MRRLLIHPVESALRRMSECPEGFFLRVLRRLVDIVPWVAPIVRYRLGELSEARARLRRGWLPVFPWQRALERKIDEMLSSTSAPSRPGLAVPQGRRVVRRVLYVVDAGAGTTRSGYTLRSEALLAGLQRLGLEVIVALRPGSALRNDALANDVLNVQTIGGIRYAACNGPGPGWCEADSVYVERFTACLRQMVQAYGIDIIHAASPYTNGLAANRAARECGIASVYEARGLWHLSRALREPGYASSEHHAYCEAQEVRVCRDATRVIALSGPLAAWMEAKGVPVDTIDVVGNAPSYALPARPAIRLRAGPLTIGYAGALVRYEGIDAVLRAMASPQLRTALLRLAGDGVQRRELERRARRYGVDHRVQFLGMLSGDELERFYASLDVFVVARADVPLIRLVPSLKPYEAMARGIPLVITRAAASALDVDLVARDDVSLFSTDDELIRVLLGAGRTRAETTGRRLPTWDARAQQVSETYRHASTDRP